jgi:ribosome-binding factor A
VLLLATQVVAAAVCPERRRGFDGALSALASVTDVYVSNDLQVRLGSVRVGREGFVGL